MKKFTVVMENGDLFEVEATTGIEAMNKVCKTEHVLMEDIEKCI